MKRKCLIIENCAFMDIKVRDEEFKNEKMQEIFSDNEILIKIVEDCARALGHYHNFVTDQILDNIDNVELEFPHDYHIEQMLKVYFDMKEEMFDFEMVHVFLYDINESEVYSIIQ